SQNEVTWIISKCVEVHPGIAAGDQAYTLVYEAPDHVEALRLPLPELCRPRLVRVLHQQFAATLEDRRADVKPGIGNTPSLFWFILDATRLHERAMLDGSDPRCNRPQHPWCAVGMRRHAFVKAAGLLGEGAHFNLRILRST